LVCNIKEILMKKGIVVLAMAALSIAFTSFAYSGSPLQSITEVSQMGNVSQSQTLDSAGTLTKSVCSNSSRGVDQLKTCVSSVEKLSKKEAAALHASLKNTQNLVLMSAEVQARATNDASSSSGTALGMSAQASHGLSKMSQGIGTRDVSQFMSSVSHTESKTDAQRAAGAISQSMGYHVAR
jgi:hypothetical protein